VRGTPRSANLRDSGAIEQDADVVLLMSRHDDEDTKAFRGESRVETLLRVDKNRNGPKGDLPLVFHPQSMKFTMVVESQQGELYR